MRSSVQFAAPVICALTLTACDPHPQEKLIYATDEKAMDAAIRQAKATLPAFWSNFDAAQSKDEYSVKVSIIAASHGGELIWMDVTGRQGDQVSGVLVNEPVNFSGHNGDKITVNSTEIVDWAYPKNGKFYGHFTTRLLAPQMSAGEQANLRDMLWPTPLEQSAH